MLSNQPFEHQFYHARKPITWYACKRFSVVCVNASLYASPRHKAGRARPGVILWLDLRKSHDDDEHYNGKYEWSRPWFLSLTHTRAPRHIHTYKPFIMRMSVCPRVRMRAYVYARTLDGFSLRQLLHPCEPKSCSNPAQPYTTKTLSITLTANTMGTESLHRNLKCALVG